MVVSSDITKLCELRDYLYVLYGRTYHDPDPHRMKGYQIEIYQFDTYSVLTRCHRDCYGTTLSYWCQADNKNQLLTDVWFLEEREGADEIYIYCNDNGIFERMDCIMDKWVGDICSKDYNFPVDLVSNAIAYFRTGEIIPEEGFTDYQ